MSAAGLLDNEYKIVRDNVNLCFPLRQELALDDLQDILRSDEFETGTMSFPPAFEGPRTLSDALSSILTPEELELLPRAYDLVGDIAILELPE